MARRALNLALACLAGPAMADMAYVTCQPGEAVSVIDIDTGRQVATWPVPGKPAGVAVGERGIFTVSPDDKRVRRYTPAGDLVSETVLDGGPIGIAIDAPRDRVYVSDWYNARLFVLTADTLTLTATLQTGTAPAGVALSKDGRWIATADKDADQVSVFDGDTLKLHARLGVGTRPFGLRFGPDGRLFVGNVGSNDVTVLDTESGETLARVPVGARPYGVAFAAGRAFVTDQYDNSVSVIDLDTLTPETRIDVGEYPEGIDATRDGRHVVLANWFDNSVTILDAETLEIVHDVATCDGPRAFGAFLLGGGD